MSAKSGQAGPVTSKGEAGPAEVAELLLVAVAVAEGAVIGVWLGAFPALALRAGGFPPAPLFFVRWAGVLHLLLGFGYGLEWLRFRRVTLLVSAKALTALFLTATLFGEGLPALMSTALVFELLMAVAGALLHGPADRSRRARARLRLVGSDAKQIRPAGQR
ncbi:MAG TPA: hypothetical protein VLV17_03045 [Anaeromyxobacteraceae bacterium]|nr:hypothetical protein [Anaeromyxobacteraceae bacterium]